MSLFKKSNRKFKQRSRRESDDEDDSNIIKIDNKEEDDLESTVTRTIETKNVKLSFADDDNEDNNQEFKLKRSSSSLRALKQLSKKSKELKKSSKQNDFINQSLNQTKSVRKYMEINKLENKEDNQHEFNQQSKIINLDDEELIDDDDEVNNYLKFKKPSFKKDILIPDNKVIEEFKRRRFLAKEYISLNSTSPLNTDFNDDNNKNSRLIREDPNDKEAFSIDDDDNEDLDDDRVNFYTDKTNIQKEKIKEAFFNAQNEDNQSDNRFGFNDKSSDDELDLWEQSQIKKGVGLQQQKELTTNEIGNFLLNNQRNQSNNFEPPSFIKSMRPALKKDKLLDKYKDELHLVTNKLDYLYNQFNNIELTINNLKETLGDN